MWWSQRGHRWQYSMAHARCMRDKQGYTRNTYVLTLMRPGIHPLTHVQVRMRKHARTERYVMLLFHDYNSFAHAPNVTLCVHCLSCSYWGLTNIRRHVYLNARSAWCPGICAPLLSLIHRPKSLYVGRFYPKNSFSFLGSCADKATTVTSRYRMHVLTAGTKSRKGRNRTALHIWGTC